VDSNLNGNKTMKISYSDSLAGKTCNHFATMYGSAKLSKLDPFQSHLTQH